MMKRKELKQYKKEIKEVIKTVDTGSKKLQELAFEFNAIFMTMEAISVVVENIKSYIDNNKIPDKLNIKIQLPYIDYNTGKSVDDYVYANITYLTVDYPYSDWTSDKPVLLLKKYAEALNNAISSYRNHLKSSSPNDATAMKFTNDLYDECVQLFHRITKDMDSYKDRLFTATYTTTTNSNNAARWLNNIIGKRVQIIDDGTRQPNNLNYKSFNSFNGTPIINPEWKGENL